MIFTKNLSIFGLRFTPKRNYQPFPSKQLVLRTKTVLSSFTSWFISKCFLSTRNFWRVRSGTMVMCLSLLHTSFNKVWTQIYAGSNSVRDVSKVLKRYSHFQIRTPLAQIPPPLNLYTWSWYKMMKPLFLILIFFISD